MARLIFESADILDGATVVGTIKGITVEGLEQTLTPEIVNVEDNREIYESYTGRIVVRTINSTFSAGSESGSPILSSSFVSTNGTVPSEGKLRLNGKAGSHTITTLPTYINGHNDFSNGRREIVLTAQASSLDGTDALDVS